MSDPRYTPLRERHEALGASFTDFGGWQMPVRYTSDLAEHHAVRQAAGIFDISHMAEFLVTGDFAGEFLDYSLAGRLSAMPVGKAKYSLMLADDGGIIDDVIVYRLADDRFLVIANAGNRGFVDSAFASRVRSFPSRIERERAPLAAGEDRTFEGFLGDRGVDVEDVSDEYALLAVQGPASEAIVSSTAGITDLSTPWVEQKYYAWADAMFLGAPLLLARTGYTGEDGFELLVRVADAPALWDALTEAGQKHGLVPAGLAARDTLRPKRACRSTATSSPVRRSRRRPGSVASSCPTKRTSSARERWMPHPTLRFSSVSSPRASAPDGRATPWSTQTVSPWVRSRVAP